MRIVSFRIGQAFQVGPVGTDRVDVELVIRKTFISGVASEHNHVPLGRPERQGIVVRSQDPRLAGSDINDAQTFPLLVVGPEPIHNLRSVGRPAREPSIGRSLGQRIRVRPIRPHNHDLGGFGRALAEETTRSKD